MAESLGVYYRINPPDASGSYTVDHSSYIYVIDRQGYLVMNWGHDVQPDEIRADLQYLLEHGIPISAQLLAGPTYTPVVCGLTLVPAHVQGGQWLYEHHCAQCHGIDLKGNPAWQTELADGSHLAPPLDRTGKIWRYSEAELIALVKAGRNLDKSIHMPAFQNTLTDWEIHFVLQYAASKWDVNQRNYQAGFFTLTPQPTWPPQQTATPTPPAP
jgi:cytochrome c